MISLEVLPKITEDSQDEADLTSNPTLLINALKNKMRIIR